MNDFLQILGAVLVLAAFALVQLRVLAAFALVQFLVLAVFAFVQLRVLAAFALVQLRVEDAQSYPYIILNVVGSGILAILAAMEVQWGFLLLEGGWALISLWNFIARITGHAPTVSQ